MGRNLMTAAFLVILVGWFFGWINGSISFQIAVSAYAIFLAIIAAKDSVCQFIYRQMNPAPNKKIDTP